MQGAVGVLQDDFSTVKDVVAVRTVKGKLEARVSWEGTRDDDSPWSEDWVKLNDLSDLGRPAGDGKGDAIGEEAESCDDERCARR